MEKPYDIYDHVVLDRNGRRLGPITGFWVDEATGKPEFASVKTGWLVGKNHVVPIRDAHFDYGSKMLRVPYDERAIKDAPAYALDAPISPAEERRIFEHYRLGRRGASNMRAGERERDVQEMALHEERVDVGKRTVDENQVRLRKVVRTETVQVPVELTRERIEIERIPANELKGTFSGRAWRDAFTDDEIVMTERREEPTIEKRSEVVGGVRATKSVDTERRDVSADVRREDVEVEGADDLTRRRLGDDL